MIALLLNACGNTAFDSSRTGNESQFDLDAEIQEDGTYKTTVTGEQEKEQIDLSELFQGINGCAVIYTPAEEQYTFFNEAMCMQEQSPYSTFKIVSALSGLQNGIITDRNSAMNYNGTVYGNADWNGDLTLLEE